MPQVSVLHSQILDSSFQTKSPYLHQVPTCIKSPFSLAICKEQVVAYLRQAMTNAFFSSFSNLLQKCCEISC